MLRFIWVEIPSALSRKGRRAEVEGEQQESPGNQPVLFFVLFFVFFAGRSDLPCQSGLRVTSNGKRVGQAQMEVLCNFRWTPVSTTRRWSLQSRA